MVISMNLLPVIENVAIVATVGFFLSGTLTMKKIYDASSVADVNCLPYIVTSINCFLWVLYGQLAKDQTLCIVNSIGIVLQLIYIVIYLRLAETAKLKSDCLKRALIAIVFAVVVVIAVKTTNSDHSVTKQRLGFLCDGVTIAMFASPLSTLGHVLKTKDTSTLSFSLSLMTVVVCFLWTSYGYFKSDLYIQVPNFLGGLLGVAQLLLFSLYNKNNNNNTKPGYNI